MKYWVMASCLFLVGCGSEGPTNVVGDADQAALDAYEASIAEADKLAEEDTDFEE